MTKQRVVDPVIYLITNKVNGKIYIGKTINPKQRWTDHCSSKTKKYPVQYAIQKYGQTNFSFEILEYHLIENLDEAEMWWIAYLESLGAILYNLTKGGDGINGYQHTPESKQLMSKKRNELLSSGWVPPKHTDDFKKQKSHDMIGHVINVGRQHSSDCEHCLLIKTRNMTNNPSKNINADTKKKMSRQKVGSLNNNAIMTEDKVKELRQLAMQGVSNRELAVRFDISPTNVSDIKNRRSWKHLP